MDPFEKGRRTEERGFKALLELKDMYPDFVLKVRRSSPALDARGIDGLLLIRLQRRSRKKTMTVPVEFKSSVWGVRNWEVKHPDLQKAGVLIFYLPSDFSPRKTRRLMYRALVRIRRNSRNGTLYHSLFQRIFRGGSRRLAEIIGLIKENRTRETK